MNSRSRTLYLLAAISLLTLGCVAGEQRLDTIARSWPTGTIKRIDLHGVDGNVDVIAGGATEISLVAHVRARGVAPEPNRENKGYFESSVDGDTLVIGDQRGVHGRGSWFFLARNDVQIDYELKVPSTTDLELKTVNGRVATRGTNGEIQAQTVNGSVDVETGGLREVELKTVNGRLQARFLNDFTGARFKTVNGSVHAVLPPTASFACDLSQVNGDFEASFPLSIHSHPGSRRVSGEVNGGRHDLTIVTVNGDIRLENAQPPAAPSAPSAPSAPAAPPVPGTSNSE
jgi:hypothetical protein